jgi:GNAT superfamily N-acetyltransferase
MQSGTTSVTMYQMGRYPFALRLGMPGDLDTVSGLVKEAAGWLRTSKNTDQWAKPWPDRIHQRERMLNDLLKGMTWLVWDGETAAATITVDTDEPVDLDEQPVWPEHARHWSALYLRRIVVARAYVGCGLGTALLDWAAHVAKRDHQAALIRIDVWTTNLELHAYFERQRFARGAGPRASLASGLPVTGAVRAGCELARLGLHKMVPGGITGPRSRLSWPGRGPTEPPTWR